MNPNRLLIALLVALAGCMSVPSPAVRDKLDAKTGSTISTLPDSIQLVTAAYRGANATAFAYLAPFEIDQMGVRTLFLWVLVPNDGPATSPPVILCDGKDVDLHLQTGGLNEMRLTEPPYKPPYPWGTQWHFLLTDAALKCFAQAHLIELEYLGTRPEPERFTIESRKDATGFPVLQAFVAHRAK